MKIDARPRRGCAQTETSGKREQKKNWKSSQFANCLQNTPWTCHKLQCAFTHISMHWHAHTCMDNGMMEMDNNLPIPASSFLLTYIAVVTHIHTAKRHIDGGVKVECDHDIYAPFGRLKCEMKRTHTIRLLYKDEIDRERKKAPRNTKAEAVVEYVLETFCAPLRSPVA